MPLLYKLNEYSKELYLQIAEEENFDFNYEEKGLLMLSGKLLSEIISDKSISLDIAAYEPERF